MMIKNTILTMTLCLTTWVCTYAQEVLPYKIYNIKGKSVTFEKMVKEVGEADMVFFGELHNNTINHWLELQVLKSLYTTHSKNLALGLEMLEADDQLIVDEYLQGTIQERHFLKEAKLWDRYKTDYHPLVDFSHKNQLQVIASNVPQRYANLVYREGLSALDKLGEGAKKYIAPLPIEVDLSLPGYTDMIKSMGGHAHGSSQPQNIALAQAVKDATMAHFCLQYGDKKIFHVNGAYHTQNFEGIIWYVQKFQPEKKVKTIHVVEQDQVHDLMDENKGVADFIIVVPKDMTKSY